MTTTAVPNPIPNQTTSIGWQEISELRYYSGYNVRKRTSIQERQQALHEGVQYLGLYDVAYFIAGRVKLNKKRHDNIMRGAITRYEQDLQWLKENYYDGKSFEFLWPRT